MADGTPSSAFIAGPAAGADVDATQAHLIADALVVVVLDARSVPAPADHQVRLDAGFITCALRNISNGIGQPFGRGQVVQRVLIELVGDMDDIPDHGTEQFGDTLDDLASTNACAGALVGAASGRGRVAAPRCQVLVGIEQGAGIVTLPPVSTARHGAAGRGRRCGWHPSGAPLPGATACPPRGTTVASDLKRGHPCTPCVRWGRPC